jgi:hypothetical protein
VLRLRRFPLARVCLLRESEREVQECVVLRSLVAEFQVIATTWGFGFLN